MSIAGYIFGTISSCGTIAGIIAILLTRRSVGQVHHMVNQQHTDSQLYQETLIAALNRAGITIPTDASLTKKDD